MLKVVPYSTLSSHPKQPSLYQSRRGRDKDDFYFKQIYDFLKNLALIKFESN